MKEKECWEDLHRKGYDRFIEEKSIDMEIGKFTCFLNRDMIALDIGCGSGNSTFAVSKYVHKCHGIDISKNVIEKARARFVSNPDLCFFEGNGRDLSIFNDNSFDFIFSISTFVHIPREFAMIYMRDCKRVLKPGGFVLFEIVSEPELNSLAFPSEKTKWGNEPHIGWSPEFLFDFILISGLDLTIISKASMTDTLSRFWVLLRNGEKQ